ncbi:MAG: hypothetical protein D6698_15580 [Gammaproteobacteria bacterium]|nr:MAG: hypothetical protein D6698_15580 [Gammaproteobacteria bacterium]
MAGEAIDVLGTYTSALAAATVTAGGFSGQSATISNTVGVTNAQYVLLDLKLKVSGVNVPTQGVTIDVYRRPSDGTDTAPAPSAGYKQQYVGSFTLDAALGSYYLYNVPKGDPNDTFYLVNNESTNSLDLELLMRPRSMKAA